MRLRTTYNTSYNTKGFLLLEIMTAFFLMTLFLVSAVVLSSSVHSLHDFGMSEIDKLQTLLSNMSSTTLFKKTDYGNYSYKTSADSISFLASNYSDGWGRETCDVRLVYTNNATTFFTKDFSIGASNASTDIKVKNGIVYLTADNPISSLPDLYIIDMKNPNTPVLISSLNTGPGLSTLEVVGPYIYAANLGSTNQLQVIDIHDRTKPLLITKLKLPLPQASSTAPNATALFYSNGYIYLGTEKWEGAEFSIIDVHNPTNPKFVSGYETNTLINTIFVINDLAYIAASDTGQMRILDVHDTNTIHEILEFSPTGWETQQGRVITYFEKQLFLGRTVGGFNVTKNHELFAFSSTSELMNSKDIPGGVYGITYRSPYFYIASHDPSHEFQIIGGDLKNVALSKSLGFAPQALACDGSNFYFATGDQWGVAALIQTNT